MLLGPNGKWRVKDQGSANGILFNTKPTREAEIEYNDVVKIGETSLEFVPSDMGTQVLMAPARSNAIIQAEQQNFQGAKDRVKQNFGQFMGGGAKPLIYIVGALGLGVLLLGDPEKAPKPKSKNQGKESGQDLASFLPSPDYNRSAETLFKDGMREYFVHNYGRARTQFETVLQISPGHVLATLYLENCNKSVEEEVKLNLEGGKKSFEAGKFRDAKGHFETVLRLLYRDQANPAYIEARDQLDKLMKVMKGEAGKT
jgi:tetratricopeptide (TPR) repeat protein